MLGAPSQAHSAAGDEDRVLDAWSRGERAPPLGWTYISLTGDHLCASLNRRLRVRHDPEKPPPSALPLIYTEPRFRSAYGA